MTLQTTPLAAVDPPSIPPSRVVDSDIS